MKKLLVVLSLAMVAFSFQVNAATLSWDGTPLSDPNANINFVASGPETLVAEVSFDSGASAFTHNWGFALSGGASVIVNVTQQIAPWLTSATLMIGSVSHNLLAGPFLGLLSGGSYNIVVKGNASAPLSEDYTVGVGQVNAVPVPAAVWLFGSALAGLMGVSRRKVA